MSNDEGMAKHQCAADYFALFGEERRPWLDPDALKEKYRALTLASHPDRRGKAESSADFAAITEAYRVLSDDKLRLQHLLRLEGAEVSTNRDIPAQFIELFSEVGGVIRETDNVLSRRENAQNALSKSLLQSKIAAQEKEIKEDLTKLSEIQAVLLQGLQSLNQAWAANPKSAIVGVEELHQRLAYLTRWIEQLQERLFRLSS